MPDAPDADCLPLPWDSEFWGFPVARVSGTRLTAPAAARCLAWCRDHGVRCLYFAADGADPATLRAAGDTGFHFVDMRVDMERAVPGHQDISPNAPDIRPAHIDDLAAACELARNSHEDTRFFKDTRFEPAQARELYAKWIAADATHGVVLVDAHGDSPATIRGYVTCRIETPDVGRIGLLAVHPASRRTGAGRRLIGSALHWCATQGATTIRVATQASNIPALSLYQHAGFRIRQTRVWFHRWFEDGH